MNILIKKFVHNISRYRKNRKKWKLYVSEFILFNKMHNQSGRTDFVLNWNQRYPRLEEKSSTTQFDAHYIYHTAWAGRVLAKTRPSTHIDISSLLYFSTLVSSFVPVEFYDYRPVDLNLENLTCKHADLLDLPFPNQSIESLSCMHVIEHIGLGRYGEPLDPDGDLKAIHELKRVLAIGGSLLFVVPVGQSIIRFNAHRIYGYDKILEYFSGLSIIQFALVDDKNKFVTNPRPEYVNQQNYGCGCWWFRK